MSAPPAPKREPSADTRNLAGEIMLACAELASLLATREAAARMAGREEMRERAAVAAGTVRGGFTANIRVSRAEQELVRDPDGPWVLNADVAAAIRALAVEEEEAHE